MRNNANWLIIVSAVLILFGAVLKLEEEKAPQPTINQQQSQGENFGIYKVPNTLPLTCEMVAGLRKPGTRGAEGYNKYYAEVDLDKRVGQDSRAVYFFVIYETARLTPCHLCTTGECTQSFRNSLCMTEKPKIRSSMTIYEDNIKDFQLLAARSPMNRGEATIPGLDFILASFKKACIDGIYPNS